MKAISKFSFLLLLMTAVLLSSFYVHSYKEVKATSKEIAASSAMKNQMMNLESATKIQIDTTIKTRTATCACGQLTITTVGPDPERRSICQCHLCQKQSGSAYAVQARFPREQVTIKGKSTTWRFPPADGMTPVTGRTCADGGGEFHFCPICGSTVYYLVDADPSRIGIKMGTFADPTFPAPMISGFEEYKFPWATNVDTLPMPGGHHN